jgi:hypothetical protein
LRSDICGPLVVVFGTCGKISVYILREDATSKRPTQDPCQTSFESIPARLGQKAPCSRSTQWFRGTETDTLFHCAALDEKIYYHIVEAGDEGI